MKKTIICTIIALVLVVGGISAIALSREKTGFNKNLNLSEEQVQILKDKIKEDLLEMAEADKITQQQYDALLQGVENGNFNFFGRGFKGKMGEKGEAFELSDEEKEEIKQKHLDMLKERLEKGEITQEEYDEMLSKAQNGEFMPFDRKMMPPVGEKNENGDKEFPSDGERPEPPKGRGFRGGREMESERKPVEE